MDERVQQEIMGLVKDQMSGSEGEVLDIFLKATGKGDDPMAVLKGAHDQLMRVGLHVAAKWTLRMAENFVQAVENNQPAVGFTALVMMGQITAIGDDEDGWMSQEIAMLNRDVQRWLSEATDEIIQGAGGGIGMQWLGEIAEEFRAMVKDVFNGIGVDDGLAKVMSDALRKDPQWSARMRDAGMEH